MILVRTASPKLRSISVLRALTVLALAAYPAGALLTGPLESGQAASLVGLALILAAFVATALIATSDKQRIVGEEESRLDEFELSLRHRALSRAYAMFSGLVLLAVIYAALARDFGWWLPDSYGQWNGVFWGGFLYATLLPTAALVWTVLPSDDGDEAQ